MKTPLLPKYENLTKFQSVLSLLPENAGNILHIDYVIRALYGELDSEAIREQKPRLFDTLSKGTSKKLWDKVLAQTTCYTIALKLAVLELAAKVNQQRQARRHIG